MATHHAPRQALNEEYPNSPWALTFSYGRALQSTTLKVAWGGGREGAKGVGCLCLCLALRHCQLL